MKGILAVLTVLVAFSTVTPCHAASEIVETFKKALYSKDSQAMTSIAVKNKAVLPAEIDTLLTEAFASLDAKEKESMFYVAEYLANEYKNVAKDAGLLKDVKRKIFESRLSPPIRPLQADGVYMVETASEDAFRHIFLPDNIIIKKGETVRWVNNDKTGHLIASVPVIGEGGISSHRIEEGQSWEHRFYRSGEYYYICFIHRVMYGKVTVEE